MLVKTKVMNRLSCSYLFIHAPKAVTGHGDALSRRCLHATVLSHPTIEAFSVLRDKAVDFQALQSLTAQVASVSDVTSGSVTYSSGFRRIGMCSFSKQSKMARAPGLRG